MVFRDLVGTLITTAWNIGYVYESCRKVTMTNERIPVKGKDYILHVIYSIQPVFKFLAQEFNDEKIKRKLNQIDWWIQHFENNYETKYFQSRPSNLTFNDAEELEKQSFGWYELLVNHFESPNTVLLTPMKLNEEIQSLKKIVGKNANGDVKDIFRCLGNGIPTPAVMITNRVAEHMVRKLYKKVIGKEAPDNATWGTLEHDLELKLGKNDPIIGLLRHRRGKRNTSQHPGGRYTQREAEQNFLYVQELIEEINKRLKKNTK